MTTIRYIILTTGAHGQHDSQDELLKGASIIIGRGGNSHIVLADPKILPEHLTLTEQGKDLWLEVAADADPALVNGQPVRNRLIQNDDVMVVADRTFQFKKNAEEWELHEYRRANAPAVHASVEESLKQLDLAHKLIPLRTLSLLCCVLVATIWFVAPLNKTNLTSWSSGPLSAKHAFIAKRCQECHVEPWKAVPDSACLSCHAVTDHAKAVSAAQGHPSHIGSCVSCHFEHLGGASPIDPDSRQCVNCHGNIKAIQADSKLSNVDSFEHHPELQVLLKSVDQKQGEFVSMSDKAKLLDPTTIKLNHQVHLKPQLRGPKGPVNLDCADCHHIDQERKLFKPISFEHDCRSCHPLNFDERLPGREVPHGNSEEIFNFVYAEYAKLALGQKSQPVKIADEQTDEVPRFRGGDAPEMPKEPDLHFEITSVLSEARKTEQMLFTKTACFLCHTIEKYQDPSLSEDNAVSHYRVVKPGIPARWFSRAQFNHGAHNEASCTSCHDRTPQSTKTSDVLIPSLTNCQNCHVDASAQKTGVPSQCITCHNFHDQIDLAKTEKKNIEELKP